MQTITGKFVKLVPLDLSRHIESLHNGSHGPDKEALWLHLRDGPFADMAAHREHLIQLSATDGFFGYVIFDLQSSNVLGQIALMKLNRENRSVEIGYVLFFPEFQRTRGGTEALYLMMRYVFETLKFRRCEWRCDSHNIKSERAALRLGFQREGVLRNHMMVKGRSRDTMIFSLLDNEWPQEKSALTSWLSDKNFDENGTSKHGLGHFR